MDNLDNFSVNLGETTRGWLFDRVYYKCGWLIHQKCVSDLSEAVQTRISEQVRLPLREQLWSNFQNIVTEEEYGT